MSVAPLNSSLSPIPSPRGRGQQLCSLATDTSVCPRSLLRAHCELGRCGDRARLQNRHCGISFGSGPWDSNFDGNIPSGHSFSTSFASRRSLSWRWMVPLTSGEEIATGAATSGSSSTDSTSCICRTRRSCAIQRTHWRESIEHCVKGGPLPRGEGACGRESQGVRVSVSSRSSQ